MYKKETPVQNRSKREFCQAFSKSVFCFALWAIPRLAGVARAVTYIVCSFACSLQNPALPHTAVQKINRSSRDIGAARQFAFFAKLSFLQKKNPADVTPLGFCKAFFKSVDQAATAERRDSSFSLPSFLFCKRKRASRDCCGSLGSSIKLLRLRSRGECLWHSFRSLAAYCSSSAHPRNICCVGFARMEMLAKYIRMRTARSAATASHPCVERSTEGINQYRHDIKKYSDAVFLPFQCYQFQLKSATLSIRTTYHMLTPANFSKKQKD